MEVPTVKAPPLSRLRRRVSSHFPPEPAWDGEARRRLQGSGASVRRRMRPPPPPLPEPPPPPHRPPHYRPSSNQTTLDDNTQSDFTYDENGRGGGSSSISSSSGFFPWYFRFADGSRRLDAAASKSDPGGSFPLTVYVQLLSWLLVVFVMYLLLPRGLRKTYCRTDRRRHRRNRNVAMIPPAGTRAGGANEEMMSTMAKRPVSPPLNISVPRIRMKDLEPPPARLGRAVDPRDPRTTAPRRAGPRHPGSRQHDDFEPLTDDFSQEESLVSLLEDSHMSSTSPSGDGGATTPTPGPQRSYLYHPAIPVSPSVKILRDTFSRLETTGIRLVAHGIQCDSKRVWIKVTYDKPKARESFAIRWQTEVQKEVTASDGRTSRIWVKRGGTGHNLPLSNVLCVDVGKNTSALAGKPALDASACFSLLTAGGSLDLEARSGLERDAIVCCLSRLLDQVHRDGDWRRLYRESPEPSTVTSAVPSDALFPEPAASSTAANTSAAAADVLDTSLGDSTLT